jgi:hypothetical protein
VQRATHKSIRVTCARALTTNDGKLCFLRAEYEKLYRIACPSTFPAYLDELDSRITRFELPLGAAVCSQPCGKVVLKVWISMLA